MVERTFHFEQALLPDGWAADVRLSVDQGMIDAVQAGVAAGPGDKRHRVALPGLPNLHSHAFQRAMAGLAEASSSGDDSFWTWREAMYRFVARLSPDHLRAIAALAYAEMLETGFTRVGEFHYLHHDRDGGRFADLAEMSLAIFDAAAETGIALTHLPVFYAHGDFGAIAPSEGQRRFVCDVDGYAGLLDRLRRPLSALPDAVLGVAPHSLRAVTLEELRAVTAGRQGPVHVHIAEQRREVEDCLAWSGMRPVEWLLGHVEVDPNWCLVHATHMTAAEAAGMAAANAVAGLCPITEANLGDGIFDGPAFPGRFGIGSDSNVLIDAIEELRLLEYGQRLATGRRNIMGGGPGRSTGGELYRRAVLGGGGALGAVSAIAPGPADFVTLDMDHASLAGRSEDAILDGLIFAAGSRAIDGVWRRGRQVVAQGRHVDRDRIAARYRSVLAELLA